MILLLLTGLLLMAVAVTFLVRGAAYSRTRAVENLESIEAYGFGAPGTPPDAEPPLTRTLNEIAVLVGDALAGRLSALKESEIRKDLIAAGFYGVTARRFLGYQAMCAVAVPLLWMWLALVLGGSTLLAILFAVPMAAVGWIGPIFILRRRARMRREQIEYDLPELIDLLVVTIEAGLGFTGSLQLAAQRLEGPLGQELRLTVQEQAMGLSTTESLKNFLLRCDTPSVRTFVRAVVQGETLGVSIGQIMRNLALEMRKRRRAAAEERAQKAPVKMLFPLIVLIFPALFIVILGPAFFVVTRELG